MPGVGNDEYVLLSHQGNIVVRTGTTTTAILNSHFLKLNSMRETMPFIFFISYSF